MSIIKTLTTEERLATRELQLASQAAQIKFHEYKAQAEAELKRLNDDAVAKGQAIFTHLTAVAKKAELDIDKIIFDFDHMAFTPKPVSVTPGPALPPPIEE